MFFPPQRIALGKVTFFTASGNIVFKTSLVSLTSCLIVPNMYSSFPTVLKITSASLRPLLFINPSAGFVMFLSVSNVIFFEGLLTSSSKLLCLSLIFSTIKVNLLGVPYVFILLYSILFSLNILVKLFFICSKVLLTNLDGNSSTPASNKRYLFIIYHLPLKVGIPFLPFV